MTTKFTRNTSTPAYFKAPVDPAFSFPAAGSAPVDWCLGIIVHFDGTMTGTKNQYLLSTGQSASSGSFNFMFYEEDATDVSGTGRMGVWLNTLGSAAIKPAYKPQAGETWMYFIQNTNTTLTLYRCPILASMPTDGSAVILDGSATRSAALTGPSGLCIGGRADLDLTRLGDQSLGRVFRVDSALTTLEMAKLAHGMEITTGLNKSPVFYYPLDTATDFANEGTSTVALTKTGSPTTSTTQPAFGYTGTSENTAPSITGNPTISGTPEVGSAIGYIPASVTGSPVPTRTQQWSLDGVDKVGATGTTYTPVAGDENKLLRVRQIETNSSGSANATSASSTIVASSGNTINLTTPPVAERIYQRQNGSFAVPIGGNYSGTAPTSIEYQLYKGDGVTVIKAWTAITATIGGGTWSAAPLIPEGPVNTNDLYRIAVRSKNGSTVLNTSAVHANLFGVGDIFAVLGSSSAQRAFEAGSGGMIPAANTRQYETSTWQVFTAGYAIRIANTLATELGVPIGMLACGVNGTTLSTWATSATNYKNTIAEVGGKLAGVLISAGSNDANSSTVVTVNKHLGYMNQLSATIRNEVTGQTSLPIFWSGMNRRFDAGTLDESANAVRTSENLYGDQLNCYHIQTLDFELGTDKVHLTTEGFVALGDRLAYVMENVLSAGVYKRGPKITELVYFDNKVKAKLTYRGGSDFSPNSGITGFNIYDANGELNVVDVSKSTSDTLLISCDRVLVEPVTTKYLQGMAPVVGTPVYSVDTQPLPMLVELTLSTTEETQGPPIMLTTDIQTRLSGGANNADPIKSLGGVISSQEASSTLFDDVTSTESINGRNESRLIYIYNNKATTLRNASIWIKTNTVGITTEVEIGKGLSGLNGTENAIATEGAIPAGIDFFVAETASTALLVGDIPANQWFPIWVRWKVAPSSPITSSDPITIRVQGSYEE